MLRPVSYELSQLVPIQGGVDQLRVASVLKAIGTGVLLDPIEFVAVEPGAEQYYIADGHTRLWVAHDRGRPLPEAVEIETDADIPESEAQKQSGSLLGMVTLNEFVRNITNYGCLSWSAEAWSPLISYCKVSHCPVTSACRTGPKINSLGRRGG